MPMSPALIRAQRRYYGKNKQTIQQRQREKMRQRRGQKFIIFAGKKFTTKNGIFRYIESILDALVLGEFVEGEAFDVLIAIIELHPDFEEEIDSITVIRNINCKDFLLNTIDGTSHIINFEDCLTASKAELIQLTTIPAILPLERALTIPPQENIDSDNSSINV